MGPPLYHHFRYIFFFAAVQSLFTLCIPPIQNWIQESAFEMSVATRSVPKPYQWLI